MSQTVLVTGATGYIAKHLVLQLLNAGYSVVGSARNTARTNEIVTAVHPHLNDPEALARLRVVPLDLTTDDGWDDAMAGVDVVMHTASPFPLAQPKDEQDLIRPAVDGAMRAVRAAQKAGIKRVIMTSSSAAIMNCDLPDGRTVHTEADWTDLTHPTASAYVKSKTLAERAVWDWSKDDAPDMQITMINPTLVVGAPLDKHYGSSIDIIERLMRGKDPMLPRLGFPCVDVRDIALMHIRAMERPDSIGKRFIGVDRSLWFTEMAELLKSEYPDRKIPTRTAPNLLVRFLALFDPAIRTILPNLGTMDLVDNSQAEQVLGLEFRDAPSSIRDSARYLTNNNLI